MIQVNIGRFEVEQARLFIYEGSWLLNIRSILSEIYLILCDGQTHSLQRESSIEKYRWTIYNHYQRWIRIFDSFQVSLAIVSWKDGHQNLCEFKCRSKLAAFSITLNLTVWFTADFFYIKKNHFSLEGDERLGNIHLPMWTVLIPKQHFLLKADSKKKLQKFNLKSDIQFQSLRWRHYRKQIWK